VQRTGKEQETQHPFHKDLVEIDLLYEAREEGAPREQIMETVEKQHSGIAGRIREVTGKNDTKTNLLIRRSLRRLYEDDLLTERALFYISQDFYLLDDWESAAEAILDIDTETLSANETVRNWTLDFMRQYVKRLLRREEFEQAIAYVEKIRRLAGEKGDPEYPLSYLAEAAAFREVGQYGIAIDIIVNELHPAVPEIARNRAVYTMEQVRDQARLDGNYREALETISSLAELYPMEYAVVRDELIASTAKNALDNNNPESALEYLEKIPEDEWSPEMEDLYDLAELRYRKANLDQDPLEMIKLAEWASDKELYQEALELLAKTRKNPNLRKVSDELTSNIRRKQDLKLLEEAEEAYQFGNMPRAIHLAGSVADNENRRSFLKEEAEKLLELARTAIEDEKEARGVQAEVIFQQGERAFFGGNFEGALKFLLLVLKEHPESPAAERAEELLPNVMRELEIAYLEGRTKELPSAIREVRLSDIQRNEELGQEIAKLMETLKEDTQELPY